jgi:signal transduction histidine kinase
MRPSKTYWRLFLPFATVLAGAMVAAWWIASSLFTSTLERRLDEQLGRAVEVLSDGTFPVTADVLGRVAALLRADVVFVGADGGVALSTLAPGSAFDTAALTALLAQSSGAGDVLTTDSAGHRIVLHRVSRDPRFVAVAAIGSLADVRTAARDAGLWFGLATALATLLLGTAGFRLLRSITGPVGRLSRMAERIAEGERDIEVAVEQSDEIGALTSALNGMAKKLAAYETELAERTRLAALGEMAARIAHEIRNPLTAIALKLELLAESGDARVASEIRAVLKEIARLDLIVTSALSTARPQRIDARPTDLNRIVEEVAALVTAQLEHQHIDLETRFGPLPAAALDEGRIKQVLFNLINNAAAAMRDGGSLRITTVAAPPGSVSLHVEDSGPGVPAAQEQGLFASTSASGRFRLGLGLNVCRELVELHGGEIVASRSDELGGARFTVVLPISIIDAPTSEQRVTHGQNPGRR